MECETLVTEFAVKLNCYIFRRRLVVSGHTQDFLGNTLFQVDNIENPVNRGRSGNFFVSTYDGLNKKIIERSYKNTDPFSFLFDYPGSLISVN